MSTFIQSITILTMAGGVLLLGTGIIVYFRRRTWIKRAHHVEGVVIELLQQRVEGTSIRSDTNPSLQREQKYRYRPVIEFKPTKGRLVRFQGMLASSPPRFQVGDKIDILYNPDAPQEAYIHRFLDIWFPVMMFIFFGFFLTGVGLIGFLLSA